MRIAPFLPNDKVRLAALSEYDVTTGSMEVELDRIVDLACSLFEVPIVLVSLVEEERQIFPAKKGVDVCATDRSISFCAHAITSPSVMVVPDARLDARFYDNPLVTGDPKIRFYAGAPLISAGGFALGTLCLIDTKPRAGFSEVDKRNLTDLACLVLDKMELRRLEVARRTSQNRFEQIAATSPDGIICVDRKGVISFWNRAATEMFGYASEEMIGAQADRVLPYERHRRDSDVQDDIPSYWIGSTIERQARRKDGTEFLTEISLSSWVDGNTVSFGAIVRDITERRSNQDRLFRLAHIDALTKLPNRRVLLNRLTESAEEATSMSMIVLDLDGFKDVNDSLGHSAGDALLEQVAERLVACVRPNDTVARMGGDEFAMLLPDMQVRALEVADRAIKSLGEPFYIDGQAVSVGASAGIAAWPLNSTNANELLSNADLALYQAKGEGRNCRRVYAADLRLAALHKRAYEGELRRAYEENEFELFYQPQIRLTDGALIGVESLLRWRHPAQGLLLPNEFMGALETSLLSAPVGEWVLEQACAQVARWRASAWPDLRMAVNLFGAQFRAGDLAALVKGVLLKEALPPAALELEITENIILRHDEAMLRPLQELHSAGVGIAFDDYGTGYASLSLLKRYPLTRLKIDRSFVQGMCTSREDAAIVRAILHLGRAFGLAVIAEGVETEDQCQRLKKKGCEEVQGFFFGQPMTVAKFETRFRLNRSLFQMGVMAHSEKAVA